MQPPLLQVSNLHVGFADQPVIYDASFSIESGTTLGLVGESGSGKSTIGKAILKLLPATSTLSGSIQFKGEDILHLSDHQFRPWRRSMQMIFQDPFYSLDPRQRIESIIAEPLEIHYRKMDRNERRVRVMELLDKVGLPKTSLPRFPHEFSGGQRQRIGIARALAVQPEFIICDEPVSALDVSVQAQILNLLKDLQDELGLTYLFIGHDLAVIQHMSNHVLVMQQGRIVESASAEKVYTAPQHPYTRQLLAAATA